MNWRLENVLCLTLQVTGFIIFCIGFFPQKNVLPGFNTISSEVSPFLLNDNAPFDKLIFIVVDALRADFMFSNSSLMHFLQSLVRDGSGLPFTAYAHPPTVTLPRLKGITTGGTPSFIDAILNVADDNDNSQGLSNFDTWLAQFKMSGRERTLHFYGDDTWLKLFPAEEFFEKYEGTDSFFVSDFTEVDNNVTRHLNSEISDQLWDGLILHYLGLDHIGHKGGPNSIYMKGKQEEMDSILQQLYESRVLTSNSTLLVIMGDHGMNDLGNHGGSSEGETSPGLLLVSPRFQNLNKGKECPPLMSSRYEFYSSIFQIDIVPTLAALLNFGIPKNNLGVIVPEILELWQDDSLKKKILLENCHQFMKLLRQQSSWLQSELQNIEREYETLLDLNSNSIHSYYQFLKSSQSELAENSTNYSYKEITLGYVLVSCTLTYIIFALTRNFKDISSQSKIIFVSFSAAYAVHFHGSSLIEEEHQIWWLLTIVPIIGLFLTRHSTLFNFLLQLICLRVIRSWNNTGQKYSTDWTMSSILTLNSSLNWLLVIVTYSVVAWPSATIQMPRHTAKRGKGTSTLGPIFNVLLASQALLSIYFKILQFLIDGKNLPSWLNYVVCLFDPGLSSEPFDKVSYQSSSVNISKLFYINLLGYFALKTIQMWNYGNSEGRSIIASITLFLIHQTRVELIPIFLIFLILEYSLMSTFLSIETPVQALVYLCVQHLSFFSMGNTNLLATVDLSNAYNGVSEYNVFIVSFLTFISNFSGVIFWLLSQTLQYIQKAPQTKWTCFHAATFYKMSFYLISMSSLIGSCINLRYHLFIWSVFSPKLLYFAVWTILVNVVVEFVLGGFLLSII